MRPVLPPRRSIILKANRDTLVLIAAAGAMTLAIANSVHTRPAPATLQGQTGGTTTEQAAAGEWAGQLADLTPNQVASTAPAEPLSTAALTLDKAAMALPASPRPAPALPSKPRICDGAPCPPPVKAAAAGTAAAAPPRHPPAVTPPAREASLVEKLNPLNHLPEMVKRPFASAGDTIAGWVKRF